MRASGIRMTIPRGRMTVSADSRPISRARVGAEADKALIGEATAERARRSIVDTTQKTASANRKAPGWTATRF
jgi:hypothetical protein